MTTTPKTLRELSLQNSDSVAEIGHELDLIMNLQKQVAWLLESFNKANLKNDDPRYYFTEWHTKLTTIEALFTYVNKDITKKYEKLEGLAEDFRKLTEEPMIN